MPRGGARHGSGRKGLGKRRVNIYLHPDILFLFSAIAMLEKTSIGAAIEKIIIDPNFGLLPLPAPHAPNENHYSVTFGDSRAILQILKTDYLDKGMRRLEKERQQGLQEPPGAP
jgi:hypothetical protein